jgi:hypothetical protein
MLHRSGVLLRIAFLALVLLSALAAAGNGTQVPKKQAVPEPGAQQKTEALIQELYQDEYTRAQKDPGEMAKLATTLLQEGKDTTDDPAGRFVLFRMARDLAAQAGDAATALQAVEELAQDFAVKGEDVFAWKVQALSTAGRAAANPESFRTIVDAALVLLDEALAADNYAAALQLVASAETAARRLKSVPLVANLRRRQQDVLRLQKDYARVEPHAAVLRANPDEPQANLEIGKYQTFIRGNWEKGLPYLAKGSDAALRDLARADLGHPRNPGGQTLLGQRWAEAAAKRKGPAHTHMLLRASHWYQLALPQLRGPEQSTVAKRLATINALLPPEYRAGDITIEIRRLDGHRGPVFGVAVAPDGRKAVSGSADSTVRLWDIRTGKELRRFDCHSGPVWTVAYAPDGRRVLSGGFDHTIRLWDLASGREVRRFQGHADYVRSVVFSQDGRRILSGGDDRTVRLWDAETGQPLRTLRGHDHYVFGVALSSDGRRALSASLDRTVRLWDVETGQEVRRFQGHQDTVLGVVFCPDGRHALSASTDRTLRLWDLETGQEIRVFRGHSGYVHSVAISPDGRRVLSGSQDNSVRLWDVETGMELHRLAGHTDMVWTVCFSSDARWALSASHDTTVRLWGGSLKQ